MTKKNKPDINVINNLVGINADNIQAALNRVEKLEKILGVVNPWDEPQDEPKIDRSKIKVTPIGEFECCTEDYSEKFCDCGDPYCPWNERYRRMVEQHKSHAKSDWDCCEDLYLSWQARDEMIDKEFGDIKPRIEGNAVTANSGITLTDYTFDPMGTKRRRGDRTGYEVDQFADKAIDIIDNLRGSVVENYAVLTLIGKLRDLVEDFNDIFDTKLREDLW